MKKEPLFKKEADLLKRKRNYDSIKIELGLSLDYVCDLCEFFDKNSNSCLKRCEIVKYNPSANLVITIPGKLEYDYCQYKRNYELLKRFLRKNKNLYDNLILKYFKSLEAHSHEKESTVNNKIKYNEVNSNEKSMNKIKLNLGCGKKIKEGYINGDIDIAYKSFGVEHIDAANLFMYKNYEVDEIYSSHLIEHFHYQQGCSVLQEWYRVLKFSGKLIIETPDFYNSCKYFSYLYEKYDQKYINYYSIEGEIYKLYGHFFSEPWKPYNQHLFLYTERQLKSILEEIGFKNIIRANAENYIENYPGNENIFLRLECEK